jgi:hypothetical protein
VRAAASAALIAVAVIVGCAPAPPAPDAPLTIIAPAGLFGSVEQAAAAESLVRWNDGNPTDDDACTEAYAAIELRDVLRRCPGFERRDFRLVAGGQLPADGDCIVLGNTRSQPLVRELDAVPSDRGSRDAFRIRARRDGGRTVWVVAGAGRTGTLYGAMALLERLGVRFYGPAEAETVLPRDAVALPTRIDTTSAPAFDVRGLWAWEPRGNDAFFRWMARRRMNLWTSAEPNVPLLRKLGMRLSGGGHAIQSEFLDPAQYFAKHPEWYGWHDGRRSPGIRGESGDNFCTSNVTAVAELARNLIASLQSGTLRNADLVQVWLLDGGRWCECDVCRALGTPSDRMLDLLERLTAAVRDARRRGDLTRDVTLSGPAYLETMAPPEKPAGARADSASLVTFFPYYRCYFHTLTDSACTEINARIANAWDGWVRSRSRAYTGPLGVCEYWNVSWFKSLPIVIPHVIARDLAAYRDAGVKSFLYMHPLTAAWGSWRLNHLVMSEALWSPGFDVDSLVADYASRAFPSAAPSMKTFYAALETATANIMAIEATIGALGASNPGGRLANPRTALMPFRQHLQAGPSAQGSPPSWVEIMTAIGAARRALDEARSRASLPAERARIEDDAARFTYGERTFELWNAMLALGSATRGDPTIDVRATLAAADSAAAALRAMRDVVRGAGEHSDAKDGLEASHVAPALAEFHRRFGTAR